MANVREKSLGAERVRSWHGCAKATVQSKKHRRSRGFAASTEDRPFSVSRTESDEVAGMMNSNEAAFEGVSNPVVNFRVIPCSHVDCHSNTSEEQACQSILQTPQGSQDDSGLFQWDLPRAGGVRAPVTTPSLRSAASERAASNCSLSTIRLHQSSSVRGWSHTNDDVLHDGFSEATEAAEAYLRSCISQSFALRRDSTPLSAAGGYASKSPQLRRGETIEEALASCCGFSGLSVQSAKFQWTPECSPLRESSWNSGHSCGVIPGVRRVSALPSHVKVSDSPLENPTEEQNFLPSRKTATRTTLTSAVPSLWLSAVRGEHETSLKTLAEAVQQMSRSLVRLEEKFGDHRAQVEQDMAELRRLLSAVVAATGAVVKC